MPEAYTVKGDAGALTKAYDTSKPGLKKKAQYLALQPAERK